VLVVVRTLREGLRLADQEAGVGVADRGDVRDDPALLVAGLVLRRQRVRHDALLVEGLLEQPARATTGTGGVRGRGPGTVGQHALAGLPAGLEDPLAVLADRQRGAADRGDPRRGGGEVRRRRAEARDLVTVVARGEVDADAFQHRLQRD